MVHDTQDPSSSETAAYEPEAIRHLREAILSGKHWYAALLESIRLWDLPEESHNGRTFHYLIANEALDWLLVAERLCEAVEDYIPEAELTAFLFHGEPPLALTEDEFEELLGRKKHHQYLNFFYGVTVEEALLLVIEEEVRKERHSAGLTRESDFVTNESHRRVYGATKAMLLRNFREEKGAPQLQSTSLTELKEFTYWLFKFRMKNSDKARIASDTRKALIWLNNQGLAWQLSRHNFPEEFIEIVPSAHV
ncbi:MAG: hypothetical protein Q7R50_00285 [Dehalococcoidales bacterium]|nr:hypothetical protein [Dehalococcoidales bacterium]